MRLNKCMNCISKVQIVLFHHNHRAIQSTNYESIILQLPLHYCFNTDLFKSVQVCKAEGKPFRFSEKANINMQASPIADKKFNKLWPSKSSLVFCFEKAFPSCFTYFSFGFPWYEKHPVEVRMQPCTATMVLNYSFNAFFIMLFLREWEIRCVCQWNSFLNSSN